jgi:hypothetical protein
MTKTTRAELDPLIGEPDRFQVIEVPMRHPLPARSPGVSNDLHFPSHLLSDPLASFACGPRIDPDFFQAREHAFDGLQQEWDAFPVLAAGHMDHDFEQQTRRIDEEVSLPPRELSN